MNVWSEERWIESQKFGRKLADTLNINGVDGSRQWNRYFKIWMWSCDDGDNVYLLSAGCWRDLKNNIILLKGFAAAFILGHEWLVIWIVLSFCSEFFFWIIASWIMSDSEHSRIPTNRVEHHNTHIRSTHTMCKWQTKTDTKAEIASKKNKIQWRTTGECTRWLATRISNPIDGLARVFFASI